ncbi:MAG: SCO family protein [Chromatiaceae bacterium]|jgi:protein SCO1/2|nr:SCO family protein [Chromatiaceae bacterium]
MTGLRALLLGASLAICAAFAIAGAEQERDAQTDAAANTDIQEPRASGRYLLMDANGRAVTNADFPGQLQLISFGYTYCPDICPTTLAEQAAIMRALGEDAAALQPIFITVDPERDTAEKLRSYTAYFHPRLIGLTGSPALIAAAARNFGVRYRKVDDPNRPADQYPVDHSAGMFLLGPDGSYIRKFGYGSSLESIIDRIQALLTEEAAQIRPQDA